jgi:hypothetical protein
MTDWLDLLQHGSDEDIVAAGEALAGVPIVVLASTYERIHPWQELLFDAPFEARRHPRRPVAMRGAKGCWVAAHRLSHKTGSANGAAIAVMRRMVRMFKLTYLNVWEFDELTIQLRNSISASMQAYGGTSHTFYNFAERMGSIITVSGKPAVGLSTEDIITLDKLDKLVKNIDRLEAKGANQ